MLCVRKQASSPRLRDGGLRLAVELLEQRDVPSVTLDNPGNQTNDDGDNVSLALTFTDTTGTSPVFTGTGLPDGLALNPDTGKITGPLSATAHLGSVYTTIITAKDGPDSDTQTFSWAVKNPVTVTNPGPQANFDGAQVSLTISAWDTTNGTLVFSAIKLPPGLSIISNTGVISGTLSSSADTNSPYTVTVSATDGTYSGSETFTWKVQYPVTMLNPGNQTNYQNDQVSLPSSASDAVGTLSFSATSLPDGLTIDPYTGKISGTISDDAEPNSPYTSTVIASDGTHSASQSFTWTVKPSLAAYIVVHDRTLATPDFWYTAGEQVGLLDKDSHPEGGSLTVTAVNGQSFTFDVPISLPSGAMLTIAEDGNFTYTPPASFVGVDSFGYTVSDGTVSTTAVATINVINRLPVVTDQTFTITHDQPFHVDAPGLLSSANDADGDPMIAVLVSSPAHGTITLQADGSFDYTPNAGFAGVDSFVYRAADGFGQSALPATVTIIVDHSAPVAAEDAYSISSSDTTTVTADIGVLTNDEDFEDPISAVLVQGPAHGTLVLHADGSFAYTPGADYTGDDSFVYVATDGSLNSAPARVYLEAGLFAQKDVYDATHDQPLIMDADGGVLANDFVPDMISPTVVLVSGPASGSLTLNADGSFSYTPGAHFTGVDTFTYQISDGQGLLSNVATVGLHVADQAPLLMMPAYPYEGQADTLLTVAAADGPLASAYDPEGDSVQAVLVQGPAHGTLNLAPDGGFQFQPAPGFVGQDGFWMRPFDGVVGGGAFFVGIDVRAAIRDVAGLFVPDLTPVPGGPAITIAGGIEYFTAAPVRINRPVRAAVVELIWRNPLLGWPIRMMRTVTSDSGGYAFTIRPGAVAPGSLFVLVWSVSAPPNSPLPTVPSKRAVGVFDVNLGIPGLPVVLNPRVGVAPAGLGGFFFPLMTGSLVNSRPYSQTAVVPGGLAANTTVNIAIGNATADDKAFWTFDAAITASRAQANLNFVDPGWALLAFHNLFPTSVTPPVLNMPLIKLSDFDDFDTIIHEYGHFVQHTSNFFPFTPLMYLAHVLGNPFGAPADHPGEGNLRLIYPTTWARRVDELAFSEGWANFYSVAAQSLDGSIPSAMWGNQVVSTNGRGSESGDLLFERKNVENAPAPLANGARNDANFGEDDEMTVTRVLWDLFDPVGGAAEPQDRIELGLQGVFNLLVRPVPAQMTPVFTLSDLSNKLLAQRPNPANKVDIGAIFELNNVSPTGLGVQIGGANVQAIGQLDGRIPTFVWTVPQGERRNFSTHELLDVFNVSVFNANYTVELLTSGPGRTH